MVLMEETVEWRGRVYRVVVERGGVSGPRHSLRWRVEARTPDGVAVETIFGAHGAVSSDVAVDTAARGMLQTALAYVRGRL